MSKQYKYVQLLHHYTNLSNTVSIFMNIHPELETESHGRVAAWRRGEQHLSATADAVWLLDDLH